ncbi:DUF4388 domain-containing protein [Geomonas sp.]|uniref:DUF4388 domain-containing protein n=1 Tax=Geomonas sp. TaxID=2651584 RepID=UPI002B4738E3|nr:DUF4388 domain-containing protein [Geomonas sp.]HJV34009.1 DUF4388 domain-containing protein [Geomonas sp.]
MISFAGNLEHLPIVDVLQLLHQTRKSGILRVNCRKGESQLVFKDGYMVSANHLNSSTRLGQVLIDLRIITPETLAKALLTQGYAGAKRKPLIITLLELGLVNEKDAYRGLEQLIEKVVVEILTWKKGTFTMEVAPMPVDAFTYYPEKLLREVSVDTQGVLMDALRLFDEKKRDGELADEEAEAEAPLQDRTNPAGDPVRQVFQLPEKAAEPPAPLKASTAASLPGKNDDTFSVDVPVAIWSHRMMKVCPACRYSTFDNEPFEVCPQCGEGNQVSLWVGYVGAVCSLLGVALLCYGLYGLTAYYGGEWEKMLPEGEPVSKVAVFFRFGFLPWLFTLFGAFFFMVARRFQLLRLNSRRQMQVAAATGVAVSAAYETAQFFSWLRLAETPSFHYYAIGAGDALLRTALFSMPFLALLRYLRSKAVVREFAG